ncbi:MAG: response regulator [Candidatus Eisenbacteria bacterium]|nr:response regulator [Candidatus Eisenbacteria bacterium]
MSLVALTLAPMLALLVLLAAFEHLSSVRTHNVRELTRANEIVAASVRVRTAAGRVRADEAPTIVALRQSVRALGVELPADGQLDSRTVEGPERELRAVERALERVMQAERDVRLLAAELAVANGPGDREESVRASLRGRSEELESACVTYAEAFGRLEKAASASDLVRVALFTAVLLGALVLVLLRLVQRTRQVQRHEERIAQLALVARHTASAVLVTDRGGRLLWANAALTHLTGWTAAEIAGREVPEWLLGSSSPEIGERIRETLQLGGVFHAEAPLRARDGREIWGAVEIVSVDGDGVHEPRCIVTFHDVTEARAARESLVESEARFRSALDSMTEGLVIQDADGTLRKCNAAAERILGLTFEQMAGRNSYDPRWRATREDGSDLPGHEHPSMIALSTGQARFGRRDGHPASRRHEGVDLRRSERDLHAGPAEARRGRDHFPRRHRAPAQRPRAAQAHAGGRAEPGRLHDHERAPRNRVRESVLRADHGLEGRGGPGAHAAHARFGADAGGHLSRHVGGARPRRTLAGRAAQSPAQRRDVPLAAHGVPAQGLASSHDALRRALRGRHGRAPALARAGPCARGSARGGPREERVPAEHEPRAAHADERHPRHGGAASAVRPSAAQRADLVTLRSSADQMLTVISQLFDFTKLGDGVPEESRVRFQLRQAFGPVREKLAAGAEARSLAWRFEISPQAPDVFLGDPGGLRQVLLHLVDNALKFTHRGEVRVQIGAEPSGDDRWRLRFEVHDTGIGIEARRQSAIFEAFEQADGSSTRRYGGLGLGLTLARLIVARMDGQLNVTSEPGKGSTFVFSVPLELAETPPVAGLTLVPPAELSARSRLDGAHIVLVDGGGAMRAAVASSFEQAGARVDAVPGAEAAIAIVRESRGGVSALVLDERGGGFDAFQVAKRVHEALAEAQPPTVLVAIAGQRGDADRCREVGVSAYLTYPLGVAELDEALDRLLALQATGSEAPTLVTRHLLREQRRSMRVLLVEDNAVNRKVATRLLERSGFEVQVAEDGRDGLERFREGGWDVVLMDMQMPVMDGISATQGIRAFEAEHGLARTPVVAVTAHTLDDDREAAREAGMDAFVSKPIQADELVRTIRTCVGDLPAGAPVDAVPPQLAEVIDWAEALERMDGDELVLHELLRLFLQDSDHMMQRLEEARASGEAKRIERAAHGLKGASATISARAVAPLAREIEGLAREGELVQALDRMQDLRIEMQRLRRALEALPEPGRKAA